MAAHEGNIGPVRSLRQESEAGLGVSRLCAGDGRFTEMTIDMRYQYLYNAGIKTLRKNLDKGYIQ